MTMLCERRRATDPKTPIDWLCKMCGHALALLGLFSLAFVLGLGAGLTYERWAPKEAKEIDCGSCKKLPKEQVK